MTNFFKHKMRRKSPLQIAGMIILGGLGIAALITLFGYIIMCLWNWLMPELFGLTTITYLQAIGLFILFKILLGGIGGGKGHKRRHDERSKYSCRERKEGDFSKWKHYGKFWEEKGEKAFDEYLENETHQNKSGSPE